MAVRGGGHHRSGAERSGGKGGSPLEGAGMWIWYAGACGTARQIVEQARRVGLSHVIIKVGDGPGFGDGRDHEVFRRQAAELIPALQDAGIAACTWSYNYLDNPECEARVANWALAQGADAHIFDIESESEGKSEAAAALLAAVREAHPDAYLGYAPLPVVDFHLGLPYWQFNAECQAVLPQFYPTDLGSSWPLGRLFDQWARWEGIWRSWGGAVPELAPVVEGYLPESPAVLWEMGDFVQERGLRGVSVWSWQHANPAVWDALRALPLPKGGARGEECAG
ncbi:MAG: hypothetical protein NTZ05_12265 [Chloroflexi bacterium]|nr:hypothetical protein [Chloroflexota bacterium]